MEGRPSGRPPDLETDLSDTPISAQEAREEKDVVRMYHPDGGAVDSFPLDADGFYIVPNGPDVEVMKGHGFLLKGEFPPAPPEQPPVPAAVHQKALDRISQLETEVRDLRMDAKAALAEHQEALDKIANLERDLAAAVKASKSK